MEEISVVYRGIRLGSVLQSRKLLMLGNRLIK
jgi:hypothetical protein